MSMPTPIVRPSRLALLAEARGLAERAGTLGLVPALLTAPRGDGHAVLVLPGLGAPDASTTLLRAFLRRLGYDAQGWRQGINRGPRGDTLARCAARLQALAAAQGRRVSLVGWSLGGLYARWLARTHPALVRQVVTLGSPLSGPPEATHAGPLYEWLSGSSVHGAAARALRDDSPLPVPSSAIHSRGDGIVPWRSCLQPESERAENLEVRGSHLALGSNAHVLWILADRLAQREGAWQPYRRSGWRLDAATDPSPRGEPT
jgi:pimeloyl-ACP methyl ester carboxylesterase